MKVLVACEFSGVVRDAFREKGHEAYSCDLLANESDYHFQEDVITLLERDPNWDLIIAHPPCEHLASSGARWFKEKREDGRQRSAVDFFLFFTALTCPMVCIENPIGIMSSVYRRPDQIVQPWQFGHPETKATCLWLKGLPKLEPTDIVEGREPRVWKMPPSKDRWMKRSITYSGIAQAMAEQWG